MTHFVLLIFQGIIIYRQISNIKKVITNQKNLTMNHYQVCLTRLYACPKQIKLLSNEKFRCRKIPYVVQYYVPNKKRALKNMCTTYFLCTIRLENEKELLSGNSPIYVSKFSEPGVIEVVNQNCSLVDPFATIVDDVFLRISWDIVTWTHIVNRRMMKSMKT